MSKVIYGIAFLLTFAVVTGIIIYLNSSYKNIFKMDFTPVSQMQAEALAKKQKAVADSLKNLAVTNQNIADSTKVDSVAVQQDSTSIAKTDSVKTTKETNSLVEKKIETKLAEKPVAIPKNEVIPTAPIITKQTANKDSIYQSWVKNTVKLYESMDSKKVAKIILGYSDNIARDIILKMKKKKAAEILSELKPEIVTRLISVGQ